MNIAFNIKANSVLREKAQFSKVKEDGSKSSPISTMVKQVFFSILSICVFSKNL